MIAILASLLLTVQSAPEAPFQLAAYRGRSSSLAPSRPRKPRVESSLKPRKPKSYYPKPRSTCGMTCKGSKTGRPKRLR